MATKRLIDANEVYEIARSSGLYDDFGRCMADLTSLKELLEDCPTVDAVEVVHGQWEKAEYHGFLRCSECKDVYIDDTWVADGKWNYCPNCGADMRGETE